jgi:hypothetical protein
MFCKSDNSPNNYKIVKSRVEIKKKEYEKNAP